MSRRHLPRPSPASTAGDQESAWRYPRPAVLEATPRHLKVVFGGKLIAETRRGLRVLETSHPPSYYFPPDDVASAFLKSAEGGSLCEWKGGARYFDVVTGGGFRAASAAWCYPNPAPAFQALRNHVAFYAGLMEACYVDDEVVTPQEGEFYGGWITSHVAGPFKGPPGTMSW